MKKEKRYVILIVILLIVLFIQLIYYRIGASKENKNQSENTITIEDFADKVPIENIDTVLDGYEGQVTKEKLRESIGLCALKTIPEIGNQTRDKSTAEIENYYDENKAMISSKEITNKDEYVSIAEDINNFSPKGNLIYRKAKLQSVSDEEESNDFYKLYLDIEYDKNIIIKLKCFLSKNTNTIEYLSNSQVEQLYKNYKVSVSKNELYSTINEFKNNVQWIRDNTKLESINNQLKFYNDNQERFKLMGINNSEDFIKISTLMSNTIEWKNNSELNNYQIVLESYKDNGDNSSIEIDFTYDYIEQLKLKMELSNVEKLKEKIRFTIYDL